MARQRLTSLLLACFIAANSIASTSVPLDMSRLYLNPSCTADVVPLQQALSNDIKSPNKVFSCRSIGLLRADCDPVPGMQTGRFDIELVREFDEKKEALQVRNGPQQLWTLRCCWHAIRIYVSDDGTTVVDMSLSDFEENVATGAIASNGARLPERHSFSFQDAVVPEMFERVVCVVSSSGIAGIAFRYLSPPSDPSLGFPTQTLRYFPNISLSHRLVAPCGNHLCLIFRAGGINDDPSGIAMIGIALQTSGHYVIEDLTFPKDSMLISKLKPACASVEPDGQNLGVLAFGLDAISSADYSDYHADLQAGKPPTIGTTIVLAAISDQSPDGFGTKFKVAVSNDVIVSRKTPILLKEVHSQSRLIRIDVVQNDQVLSKIVSSRDNWLIPSE